MIYQVPVPLWWLMFAWGALGWIGMGGVSLFSARHCRHLESGLKFWHDRALAPNTTMLPPPIPSARPLGDTGTSWRDSGLHTQVHVSRKAPPTRSYTPAQVRAAHLLSRK